MNSFLEKQTNMIWEHLLEMRRRLSNSRLKNSDSIFIWGEGPTVQGGGHDCQKKSRFNFNFLVYSLGGPAGGGGEVCSSTIRIRSIHQVELNTTTTTAPAPATDLTTFQWDERQGEANKQTVCWSNASAVETFGCKGALNKHCNPSQVANTPKSCLNGKTTEKIKSNKVTKIKWTS